MQIRNLRDQQPYGRLLQGEFGFIHYVDYWCEIMIFSLGGVDTLYYRAGYFTHILQLRLSKTTLLHNRIFFLLLSCEI